LQRPVDYPINGSTRKKELVPLEVWKMAVLAFQRCINPGCAKTFDVTEVLPGCPGCGELLDVDYEWDRAGLPDRFRDLLDGGRERGRVSSSGVWRFRKLLPFADEAGCVTIGEGRTLFRAAPGVAAYVGLKPDRVFLQYEGMNPSGSFKDNGMAAAFTHARITGAKVAACASTGNTSASLAAFASATGLMKAVVFMGSGKIALGKLSQALEYGARTFEIDGDFDDAMARVLEVASRQGLYLVNSVNPFRLEGQKTIMYRIIEGLSSDVPDWIVCPGGNLGNSSAFGKAFHELGELGLVDRLPRLAVVNATGAPTLSRLVNERGLRWNGGAYDRALVRSYYENEVGRARTVASAIEINRPVNLAKCLRAIEWTDGVVRDCTDEEILDAKAVVGREGIGCEPASAASVAGLKRLVEEGAVDRDARVACVLTGHLLKAPEATIGYHAGDGSLARYGVGKAAFANRPVKLPNDIEAILEAVRREG
jgi:threonine synthase